MPNRILKKIASTKEQIANRLEIGLTTQKKLDDLHKSLDMECDEYCKFQELKTLAMAEGLLTLDEATTIYDFLGNTPETFNRQSLPVKVVLTQLLQMLLQRRLQGR